MARSAHGPYFPIEEFEGRFARVRERMAERELRAILVSAPENVYYLTGLDHQGYFAYELLIVPLEGDAILITRAMEKATVRDQVPWVKHIGYSDGVDPLPRPDDVEQDLLMVEAEPGGEPVGLRPWEMSVGVAVSGPVADSPDPPSKATIEALGDLHLTSGRLGIEKSSSFLPFSIAERIVGSAAEAEWVDCSGLVDDCRLVQTPRELECTRAAAVVSDSMMLAAIAAAGPGVRECDIMAAVYDAMFRRGGTYPGFIPLVRSTHTIEHEHGTWTSGTLRSKDLLFLEMAGCVRRYLAPTGRLAFIGKSATRNERTRRTCEEALLRAVEVIGPGVKAGDVYRGWHEVLDRAGLHTYHRHHCGYAVGIGFPPSWSGSGTPRGLRISSDMELQSGMVFHLMSWLLRTGKGDSFLSDTIVVTDTGCELLTNSSRELIVR